MGHFEFDGSDGHLLPLDPDSRCLPEAVPGPGGHSLHLSCGPSASLGVSLNSLKRLNKEKFMDATQPDEGPVLRLFQVKIKEGHAETLMKKFATTSAGVVRHEPGNSGYFFGRGFAPDEGYLVFASLWDTIESVKQRFGDTWQQSFLPEGYDDLIEEHSIRHIDLSSGWFVPAREPE